MLRRIFGKKKSDPIVEKRGATAAPVFSVKSLAANRKIYSGEPFDASFDPQVDQEILSFLHPNELQAPEQIISGYKNLLINFQNVAKVCFPEEKIDFLESSPRPGYYQSTYALYCDKFRSELYAVIKEYDPERSNLARDLIRDCIMHYAYANQSDEMGLLDALIADPRKRDFVRLLLEQGVILHESILLAIINRNMFTSPILDLALLEKSIVYFCQENPNLAGELLDILIDSPDDVPLATLLIRNGAALSGCILLDAIGFGRPLELIRQILDREMPNGFYIYNDTPVNILFFAAIHPDPKVYSLVLKYYSEIYSIIRVLELLYEVQKSGGDVHFPRKMGISLPVSYEVCQKGIDRMLPTVEKIDANKALSVLLRIADKEEKTCDELLCFYDKHIHLPCFNQIERFRLFSGNQYEDFYQEEKVQFIEYVQRRLCQLMVDDVLSLDEIRINEGFVEYCSNCRAVLSSRPFFENHPGVTVEYRNRLLHRIHELEKLISLDNTQSLTLR